MKSITRIELLKNMEESIARNSSSSSHPFPFFYTTNLFPHIFYKNIISMMPDLHQYERSDQRRTTNRNSLEFRRRINLTEKISTSRLNGQQLNFWKFLSNTLSSTKFSSIIKKEFAPQLARRYRTSEPNTRTRIELISDLNGYEIKPHTDAPHKIITILFYFPETLEQTNLGTHIYEPRVHGFTEETGKQLSFELFKTYSEIPFLPNSMLAFMKTNNSFHGRPKIKQNLERRNWMNCSIQLEDSFVSQ